MVIRKDSNIMNLQYILDRLEAKARSKAENNPRTSPPGVENRTVQTEAEAQPEPSPPPIIPIKPIKQDSGADVEPSPSPIIPIFPIFCDGEREMSLSGSVGCSGVAASLPPGGGGSGDFYSLNRRLKNQRLKPAEATTLQIEWFLNHNINLFDVGIFSQTTDAPVYKLDETDATIKSMLKFLRHKNSHQHDIYIRPARSLPVAPYLFFDDINPDVAIKLSATYDVLIIETSLKNYQAWIAITQNITQDERKQTQERLQPVLGSDAGCKDGMHFGRLAGFKNMKPTRNKAWVNIAESFGGKLQYNIYDEIILVDKTQDYLNKTETEQDKIADAISLLDCLNPDEIEYDEWYKIASALANSNLKDVWFSFNQRSTCSERDTEKVWRAVSKNPKCKLNTIFWVCKQHGVKLQHRYVKQLSSMPVQEVKPVHSIACETAAVLNHYGQPCKICGKPDAEIMATSKTEGITYICKDCVVPF